MNATQGNLVSTIIGMYPRPCRVAIPVIVVQIGLQRLHGLNIFELHICRPFVLFDLCTVFTCFVVCTVHCAALQVVCLPFRAKPCYAKVPAPTGSEEVPIAFKFLAQPGGAVQVPKSFSQRCREFLATTSLCKSSF